MSTELPHEPPAGGEDPRALELALRITDDAPVDWELTRQTATDLSETLEWMRQLQILGELHHRQGTTAAAEKPQFTWGPLKALEQIGEGGFGEVWRAWDPSLQREVALKLRRTGQDPSGATRWLREAQRLARVRHAHVLIVHGTDIHDGRAGIWTELIRGRTLEERLQSEGPSSAQETALIGQQLCAALAAVHGAGLVHGDIKTRNVMREGSASRAERAAGSGRIVLMDFGTASESERIGLAAAAGTPLYAAPELLAGGDPSPASDLYALGVVLYRLLTGRFPIEATSMDDLRAKLARGEVTPLRSLRPDLPGSLVEVIERSLASDPARRFQSAADMERALLTVFAPGAPAREADAATRWRFVTGMLVGALVAALGAWGFLQLRERATPRFKMATGVAATPFVLQNLVPDTEIGQWRGGTSAVGDFDGDGHPDVATGAIFEGGGVVHVRFGDGHGGFPRSLDFGNGSTSQSFGAAMCAGDVNGDGHPDLVVAGWDTHRPSPGAAHLYFGGPAFDSTADLVITGSCPDGAYGYSVACGDWNGDGVADLAVGANTDNGGHGPASGRVYVYFGGPNLSGTAGAELACNESDAIFGSSVDLGGDLNGDGIADLAVSAPWDNSDGMLAGRTYIFYGGRTPSTRAGLILHGHTPDHGFGPARFVGDLDEDGFDDLLVSNEHGDGFEHASGSAYLFRGSRTPLATPAVVFKGEHEGDGFGRWANAIGDITGDGHPDLAISAWWSDISGPSSGVVYIYCGGPHLMTDPVLRIPSPGSGERFGTAVASAGDLDGDGLPELLIGAPAQSHVTLGGQYIAWFHRHVFTRPREGESWTAGQPAVVSWQGNERARLEWSNDRRHWHMLLDHIGGNEQNLVRVAIPREAVGAAYLRLKPANPRISGESISPAVTVAAAR